MPALSQVGRTVTSTQDRDEVLRRIVDAGVFLTKAEEGFLAMLDQETGQLYLLAAKNIDEDKVTTMRLPVTDSNIGQVLRTQRPLRIVKAQDSLPLKVSTGYLVYSMIIVPIISHGTSLGVLTVDNRTMRRAFIEKDESVLMSLADYAGQAYDSILGGVSTGALVIASLVAYWAGEFSNSFVLAKMKILTRGRWLWTRTIGSTLVGEGVDTLLFVSLATLFKVPGVVPQIWLTLVATNYLFKVSIEALMTPVTYRVVNWLKRVEGEDYYDYKTDFHPFKV